MLSDPYRRWLLIFVLISRGRRIPENRHIIVVMDDPKINNQSCHGEYEVSSSSSMEEDSVFSAEQQLLDVDANNMMASYANNNLPPPPPPTFNVEGCCTIEHLPVFSDG